MDRQDVGSGRDSLEKTRLPTKKEDNGGGFAHLGYLAPILLSPILYNGSQESKCAYSLLLLLLLWAFNSAPKPITAFLPVVNYPLFKIMTPQQVAENYFSMDILCTVSMFMLATEVETATSLVPRLGLGLCARFGLRRRRPFLALCFSTFLAAMVLSSTVLATPLLYLIDRVLWFLHDENLDSGSEASASRPRSQDNVSASTCPDTDALFDQLAQAVLRMRSSKQLQFRRLRRTPKSEEDNSDPKDVASDITLPKTPSPTKPVAVRRHSISSPREITGPDSPDISRTVMAQQRSRRPSILKDQKPKDAPARRSSSVDFGRTEIKTIDAISKDKAKQWKATGATPTAPEPLSISPRSSLASTQSQFGRMESTYNTIRGSQGTLFGAMYSVHGLARLDSVDSGTRYPMAAKGRAYSVGQLNAVQEIEHLKKARERRHVDVRSAFLIAPAMACMLGSLASLHTLPGKEAFADVLQAKKNARDVGLVTWSVIALPASLVALLFCCLYFYRNNLKPHEPEEEEQHLTIIGAAETRLKAMGPPSRRDYMCFYYVAFYVVCSGIALLHGYNWPQSQVTIIFLLLILTSASTPWSKKRLSRRLIRTKLPWGVIFVLGGAQVATQLVADKDLIGSTMRYIRVDGEFWRHRSPVFSQTILAVAACIMAETINGVVLSQILMRIVENVALVTNKQAAYYAIPVAVGACTNSIMPMSLPFAILHNSIEVTLMQLLIAGIAVKTLLLALVLLSVNTAGRFLFSLSDPLLAQRGAGVGLRNATTV